MKNLLLIFLLFPALAFAAGKDTIKSGQTYLGLNAGIDFAPERLIHPQSNSIWMDYFGTGYAIDVSGRVQLFHSQFGLVAKLSYYSNGFDMDKYMTVNNANSDIGVAALSQGSFSQFSPMIGISFRHSFGKLALEARLLGGMDFVTLPNSSIDLDDPTERLSQTYVTSPGFDWDAGVGLSYAVCKRLSANFNIDFVNGSAPYGATEYKDYNIGVNYTYTSSNTAIVALLSATIGVCYNF